MKLAGTQKLFLIALASLSLAACAPASKMGTIARSNGAANVGGNSYNGVSACGTSAGRIYDSPVVTGVAVGSFEQRVKSLVSASLDPSLFGSIDGSSSGTNCVGLSGRLSYDPNSGTVNAAQSSLVITVNDSFVTTQSESPYEINFTAASTGTFSSADKSFTLQFQDDYGLVLLKGAVSGGLATGVVYFQNSKSYNNASPSSALTALGAFSIPASSFAP
jgi:hypothetical protein